MIEHVERNFRNFSAIPRQFFTIQYGFDTAWEECKKL